ncbi:hypothetical protein HDU96_005992 [Phlyctochytrium bullatum]|nr:hypothetical protein HDU96_005992 [Phlyctochytrium bullatum]
MPTAATLGRRSFSIPAFMSSPTIFGRTAAKFPSLPRPPTSPHFKPQLAPSMQIRTAFTGLRPKRMKFQKAFKGFYKSRPHSLRGTTLTIGNFGLRVIEGGKLKDKQLDQLRTVVRRALKEEKGAKFYFKVFTARPVSKKAAETRMGKGKGAVEYFATWVSKGKIILEVNCTRKETAIKALRIAADAMPLRTSVVQLGPEGHRRAPRCLPHFIKLKAHQHELAERLEKRTKEEIERGVRAPPLSKKIA